MTLEWRPLGCESLVDAPLATGELTEAQTSYVALVVVETAFDAGTPCSVGGYFIFS